ncbi:hypothetical protein F5880DRAFT_1511997, partial [Lentinula raphanica]
MWFPILRGSQPWEFTDQSILSGSEAGSIGRVKTIWTRSPDLSRSASNYDEPPTNNYEDLEMTLFRGATEEDEGWLLPQRSAIFLVIIMGQWLPLSKHLRTLNRGASSKSLSFSEPSALGCCSLSKLSLLKLHEQIDSESLITLKRRMPQLSVGTWQGLRVFHAASVIYSMLYNCFLSYHENVAMLSAHAFMNGRGRQGKFWLISDMSIKTHASEYPLTRYHIL